MNCHVCGSSEFSYTRVLWKELIEEWQLAEYEVDYINRQQGLPCKRCGSNLRSVALAKAITNSYHYEGILSEFIDTPRAKGLKLLEINPAGGLTSILMPLEGHKLVSYPDYDMTKLAIESASFDLVVHSDTLEHVEYPITALSECRRVLSSGGRCIFTVPVVVDRLTRSRAGLKPCYHGSQGETGSDFLVRTEFGSDVWKYVVEAGFQSSTFHCVDYPAGIAIEARV